MRTYSKIVRDVAQFAGEVAVETLWPTRCAICDLPGSVLCASCSSSLPFLDQWRACTHCGSSYGLVQCDLCNAVSLKRLGLTALPFSACVSATLFSDITGQVVRVFKDHGERRLADDMAKLIQRVIPITWEFDAITFIPATKEAFRHRGFDHCELLARKLAGRLNKKCVCMLDRPLSRDQRTLVARERVLNLRKAFHASRARTQGLSFLLVDDVFTTGSTLCSAAAALLAAGALEVRCATFTRVGA